MTLGLTIDTPMSRTEICSMLAMYGHYGNVGGVKYTDLFEKAMEIAESVEGFDHVAVTAKRKRTSILPTIERYAFMTIRCLDYASFETLYVLPSYTDMTAANRVHYAGSSQYLFIRCYD